MQDREACYKICILDISQIKGGALTKKPILNGNKRKKTPTTLKHDYLKLQWFYL